MSGSLPLDADRRATKRRDEDFQKAGRRGHRRPTTALEGTPALRA
jgi:hypothetical protein